ncbi:hypothetical protein [Candidatus Electronema sp. PJ]
MIFRTLNRVLPLVLLLLLAAVPVMAAEFILFYSNDVHGETEPCG